MAGAADYAAVGMALKSFEMKLKKEPAHQMQIEAIEKEMLSVFDVTQMFLLNN